MPIKVAAPYESATKLLPAAIEKYLSSGLVDPKLIVDAKLADGKLGQITGYAALHRVFYLGLDGLLGGKPIAKVAKYVGWRAELVDSKNQTVAAADLVITRTALDIANVTYGPRAVNSGKAKTVAERWSQKSKDDQELAFLKIPGAYCTLFWLRSNDGTADKFVPIAPCPQTIKPDKVYNESALRDALRALARKQLAFPVPGATKRRSRRAAVKRHSRRRVSKPAKAKRRSRQRR